MFAVVKTGGKQYKVSPGDVLKIERLEGEAGQHIDLSSILLINDEGKVSIGSPLLEKAQIRATIVEQTRGDKIIVFKKKRRQGYRRKAGHRQDLTVIRIEEILPQGGSSNVMMKKTLKDEATKDPQKESPVKAEKSSLKEQAVSQKKEKSSQKEESVKKETSSTAQAKKVTEKPTSTKKSSSSKKEKTT